MGMVYCVSDIHGKPDKLERMLELIRFSDSDQMYILGDAIDRGALGVDILRKIMDTPNMTMLLGNHEQMCLDTLGTHNKSGARELWRQNGGAPTYREPLYPRTSHERNMILLSCRPAGSTGHRSRFPEILSCPRFSRRTPRYPHLGPGCRR